MPADSAETVGGYTSKVIEEKIDQHRQGYVCVQSVKLNHLAAFLWNETGRRGSGAKFFLQPSIYSSSIPSVASF